MRFTGLFLVLAVTWVVLGTSETFAAGSQTVTKQEAGESKRAKEESWAFFLKMSDLAETLFKQGIADPRGGIYRTIRVRSAKLGDTKDEIVETHGWVLPPDKNGKTYAVCHDGLLYPVLVAGEQVNFDADIAYLLKPAAPQTMITGGKKATPQFRLLSGEYPTLLQVLYLVALNGDLTQIQALYGAWEAQTLSQMSKRQEIQRDPYLYIITGWMRALYNRAIRSRSVGDDQQAAEDTERLSSALLLVNAEAYRRGFRNYANGAIRTGPSYILFLDDLPELKSDSARRVALPPRPPLDADALAKLPRDERIAELIDRLDDITAGPQAPHWLVGWQQHPLIQALVDEGDTTVEPLLDVLEFDERLTRAIVHSRRSSGTVHLVSVQEVVWECLTRIVDAPELTASSTRPTVTQVRQWWARNKGRSRAERWLAALQNDEDGRNALPAPNSELEKWSRALRHCQRLKENAERLVEPANIVRFGNAITRTVAKSGAARLPMKGEPLRAKYSGQVFDILRQRALELSEPGPQKWGEEYAAAASIAGNLYEWEPQNAQTLPTLREVMHRCADWERRAQKERGYSNPFPLPQRMAELTLARVRLGDRDAPSDCADWLQNEPSNVLDILAERPLNELWSEAEAAVLTQKSPLRNRAVRELFTSDLMRVFAFRRIGVLRLNDTTTLKAARSGKGGQLGPLPRICDRCALALSRSVAGAPHFDPLASIARRDAQCSALIGWLIHYNPATSKANTDGPTLDNEQGRRRPAVKGESAPIVLSF